jgi:hypothetical protein
VSDRASAAFRLLHLAREVAFTEAPLLVLAAAAVEAEAADGGAGLRATAAVEDPRLALMLTAAAGMASPANGRDAVARMASRVPEGMLAEALFDCEPFLARIDPAWAWQLTVSLLGDSGARASVVGLFLSARDRALVPALSAGRPVPFEERRAADECARAAVRGELRDPDDPRLAPVLRDLTGYEANAYLVAAAFADAAFGLRRADALAERGVPSAAALTIVARRAVAAGLGPDIASRAPTYLDWTQAAAFSGALAPDEIEALAASFVPRLVDDADFGRRHAAGVPLVAALAAVRRVEACAALARRATLPPLSVVQLLINLRCSSVLAALAENETFSEWSRANPGAWADELDGGPVLPGGAASVHDALIVSAAAPWDVVPGSLEDELGLP